MGANAQTTVPTFTAAQVLTADQMNQSARTGVPVFADSTARDAGFGGTGEKVLAEGQLCYLESTNVVQYYDGSVWATVGPSTPGGLVYLTGASFTTATSFSLPNDTFTSSYLNYRILWSITALTGDSDFTMRLRASGSDNTTNVYETSFTGIGNGGTGVSITSSTSSSFLMGESDAGVASNVSYRGALDIFSPQTATTTVIMGQFAYVNKAATASIVQNGGGRFNGATVFDALSFISSSASSMTGSYRVYGYANS